MCMRGNGRNYQNTNIRDLYNPTTKICAPLINKKGKLCTLYEMNSLLLKFDKPPSLELSFVIIMIDH